MINMLPETIILTAHQFVKVAVLLCIKIVMHRHIKASLARTDMQIV